MNKREKYLVVLILFATVLFPKLAFSSSDDNGSNNSVSVMKVNGFYFGYINGYPATNFDINGNYQSFFWRKNVDEISTKPYITDGYGTVEFCVGNTIDDFSEVRCSDEVFTEGASPLGKEIVQDVVSLNVRLLNSNDLEEGVAPVSLYEIVSNQAEITFSYQVNFDHQDNVLSSKLNVKSPENPEIPLHSYFVAGNIRFDLIKIKSCTVIGFKYGVETYVDECTESFDIKKFACIRSLDEANHDYCINPSASNSYYGGYSTLPADIVGRPYKLRLSGGVTVIAGKYSNFTYKKSILVDKSIENSNELSSYYDRSKAFGDYSTIKSMKAIVGKDRPTITPKVNQGCVENIDTKEKFCLNIGEKTGLILRFSSMPDYIFGAGMKGSKLRVIVPSGIKVKLGYYDRHAYAANHTFTQSTDDLGHIKADDGKVYDFNNISSMSVYAN